MKIEKRYIDQNDPLIWELPPYHPMVQESVELEAWYVDGEPVVLLGFVRASLISDNAYVWSWTFPAVARYKKTLLRASKRLLSETLAKYPVLYGHCTHDSVWMRFLGAKIIPLTSTIATFTIEAA